VLCVVNLVVSDAQKGTRAANAFAIEAMVEAMRMEGLP
jgi:hypothetical protein